MLCSVPFEAVGIRTRRSMVSPGGTKPPCARTGVVSTRENLSWGGRLSRRYATAKYGVSGGGASSAVLQGRRASVPSFVILTRSQKLEARGASVGGATTVSCGAAALASTGRRAAIRNDATADATRRRSASAGGRIEDQRVMRATRALDPSAVHVVGKPLIVVHAPYSLEVFLEKAP